MRQEAVREARSPRFYRPELDALRFIAFLIVFWSHLGKFWGYEVDSLGVFGVPTFFLLSSYLIVTILLKEKESTGSIALGSFAARRILRIWPLYFAVLGISYLLSLKYSSDYISPHGIRDLLLLCGNVFVARNGWKLAAIAPLWSISVEEQFYVAIPLISRLSSRRLLAVIFAVVIAGSYLCLVLIRNEPWNQIWPNSFVQFQFFGVGGLIAIHQYKRQWRLRPLARVGLAVATIAAGILAFNIGFDEPLYLFPVALIGATTLFYSVAGIECHIPRPLVYLGKISYGLYVFHELVIDHLFHEFRVSQFFDRHLFTGSVVAFALTVLCAALSYRFFESPFLKLKTRFERVRTRPV